MSLLDDINEWYNTEKAPPLWVDDFDLVGESVINELRWGYLKQWVFKRGNEYVSVKDVEPATEMQDWGDYGEPEIYLVEPLEVTVIAYKRIGAPA